MIKTREHFINGQFIADKNDRKGDIYNPATGEVSATVAFANPQEVDLAINAAEQAFLKWSKVPPLKRARIIFKFKEALEKNIDQLAHLLTMEHGKVLEDARGEVLRAIEVTEFSCGMPCLLKGSYSENVATDIDSYTIRQPLGVCVGVTPFNFPVMISTWMFVPAIACGNTFILKPSEKDPSATLLLAELMQAAGLPNGVLNVLNGDKEVVDSLITHPGVAAVSCVGSTPVAESIYKTAIEHGKRSHTFGGAKNHCLLMPDADMEDAANAIVGAAFGAAGERCMALSVVVAVTDKVADALIHTLKEKVPQLKIAPGTVEGVEMGPLVTKEHRDRVKSYVDLGVEEGAELIVDGRDLSIKGSEQGFFMGGCLFDKVRPDMRIYKEEIFGPVLVIVRVPDFDTGVRLVNDHEYGNGVAIFTRDGGTARQFASAVQAGMIGINVPIPVPVAYHTFGGWKRSLFGDTHMHGAESMHFYTKSKTITSRWLKGEKAVTSYNMPNN